MTGTSVVCRKRYRSDLAGCLRKILIPQAWKELHEAAGDFEENRSRWRLQPLIYAGLTMALDTSPTMCERFDIARELDAVLRPKGRRCGRTAAGFVEALSQLPLTVVAAFKEILQQHLRSESARVGRWEAFSLDGSKQNLPRTDANEASYGGATKEPALPQSLTVVAVALGQGVLWDWASGRSTDSERTLASPIIARLPVSALAVLDAGFVGYDFIKQTVDGGRHVLVRVGSNASFWAERIGEVKQAGGEVWLWPDRKSKSAPLRLRIIKIVDVKRKRIRQKGSRRRKWKRIQNVVWLATDVLDEKALTDSEASDIFKRRWGGSEIRFRDWKCTLDCATLVSRTPKQARLESELSLCAAMLLQVLGMLTQHDRNRKLRPVSLANMTRVWRKALRKAAQRRSTAWLSKLISQAVVDDYQRKRPKVKRRWPRRKDHRWPGQPNFRKLTNRIKTLGSTRLKEKCA